MRINVLNGLRGYAAILVILSHMTQVSNTELGRSIYTFVQGFNFGYLGVDLFFVLSGFLITRILIREKTAGTFSFKLFYLKRALRIFPIYFLSIAVCGLLFSWEGMGYLSIYAANYYFTFENSPHPLEHTWSLSVEEHYYLIWPLIVYFFHSETIRKYCYLIVGLIVLLSLFLVYEIFDEDISMRLVYMGTEFRILSLCMGSTLAFYEKRLMALPKQVATRWLLLLNAVTILLVVLTQIGMFMKFAPLPATRLLVFSVCSTMLFLLVLIQENRNNGFNSLFSNKYIGYLGKISYGLYLYHFPIFFAWEISNNQLDGAPIACTSLITPLLLTFVLAAASYRFIEEPLIRYKDKMAIRMRQKALEPQP